MHGLTHCMDGTFLQLQIMQNVEVLHRNVFCIFLHDTDILNCSRASSENSQHKSIHRENHDSPLSIMSPCWAPGHLIQLGLILKALGEEGREGHFL